LKIVQDALLSPCRGEAGREVRSGERPGEGFGAGERGA